MNRKMCCLISNDLHRRGSWSQCMRKRERGLPMNRTAALPSRSSHERTGGGEGSEDALRSDALRLGRAAVRPSVVHGRNARLWNRGVSPETL